jgi:hypothetical protein
MNGPGWLRSGRALRGQENSTEMRLFPCTRRPGPVSVDYTETFGFMCVSDGKAHVGIRVAYTSVNLLENYF